MSTTKTMKAPMNGTAKVSAPASPATKWQTALDEAQRLRVRCDQIREALARSREDRVTAAATAIVEGMPSVAVDVDSLPDAKIQGELTATLERIESLELAATALSIDAMAELQRGVESGLAEINRQGIETAQRLVAAWDALSAELVEIMRLSKASSDRLAEFGTMHRQHTGRNPQWSHRVMFPISTGEVWGRVRALISMNHIGGLSTQSERFKITMQTIASPAARKAVDDDTVEAEDELVTTE